MTRARAAEVGWRDKGGGKRRGERGGEKKGVVRTETRPGAEARKYIREAGLIFS